MVRWVSGRAPPSALPCISSVVEIDSWKQFEPCWDPPEGSTNEWAKRKGKARRKIINKGCRVPFSHRSFFSAWLEICLGRDNNAAALIPTTGQAGPCHLRDGRTYICKYTVIVKVVQYQSKCRTCPRQLLITNNWGDIRTSRRQSLRGSKCGYDNWYGFKRENLLVNHF